MIQPPNNSKRRTSPGPRTRATIEIVERQRAEAALTAAKKEAELRTLELQHRQDELTADLQAMNRLYGLSTRLLSADDLQSLLKGILTCTIDLQHADFGYMQLYNRETKVLDIAVQHGFSQECLDYFRAVDEDSAACGRAIRGERVIIEDVERDVGFAPHRPMAQRAGFRAVHSTPLFSREGELLGMLSTHFRNPHRPSDCELRLTDLYVQRAAEIVERKRAEELLQQATRKNITERKQVEEHLRRSEGYLAEAERLSHTGSWAWNVSTGELFWSLEHFRICGVDPETFTPTIDSARQLIHPNDLAAAIETFDEAIQKRTDVDWDLRFVRPDGTIAFVRSRAHPVFNESGELTEYVGTVIDITEQKRVEQEHTNLIRRTMAAQEDERRRIAREMHDQLGERLSALAINIAGLRAECGGRPALTTYLDGLDATARQLDGDVRFLVWELRPTALDDLGLDVALTTYVKRWAQHFGISAQVHVSGLEKNRLTAEAETTLYRITQEALTNIAKHANANHVAVILERRRDHVSLMVEDDGVGSGAMPAGDDEKTWGLVGMRERAALVGGSLDFESNGRGITVVARIPSPFVSKADDRHA
jgi:signal transduction histidine kinase